MPVAGARSAAPGRTEAAAADIARRRLVLLAAVGFCINCQPSEPWLSQYLVDGKGLTDQQLDDDVWPYDTYGAFLFMLPVGLLAESVGYRPVIFGGLCCREATRLLLLFGEGVRARPGALIVAPARLVSPRLVCGGTRLLRSGAEARVRRRDRPCLGPHPGHPLPSARPACQAMAAMQLTYAAATCVNTVYFAYVYMVLEPHQFKLGTAVIMSAYHFGNVVGSLVGQGMVYLARGACGASRSLHPERARARGERRAERGGGDGTGQK